MACYKSKVIAIARNEIGYREKASNSNLDSKTANAGDNNWNKYARDFDMKWPNWFNGKKNGYDWCDIFVDWCFVTAYGYNDALRLLCQPEHSCGAGCPFSAAYFSRKMQLHQTPESGDQVFFGKHIDDCYHTGIVVDVCPGYITVVEGNSGEKVSIKNYKVPNCNIVGFGRPAYDKEIDNKPSPTPTVKEYHTVGDIVEFTGNTHYENSNARLGNRCKGGTCKVTAVSRGNLHPYHLVHEDNDCTVYGWVDERYITSKRSNEVVHVVKPGDTLWDIAMKYGTSVDNLVKLNGIKNPDLIVSGQKIKVK